MAKTFKPLSPRLKKSDLFSISHNVKSLPLINRSLFQSVAVGYEPKCSGLKHAGINSFGPPYGSALKI